MLERRQFLQLTAQIVIPVCWKLGLGIERAPKFKIGDRIYCEWLCDDDLDREYYGKMLRVDGTVIGICWSPPGLESGWSYVINWDDHNPNYPLDWQPWHESELM